jgi:oxygen-independent coproporphyrinogen-3 oxidase
VSSSESFRAGAPLGIYLHSPFCVSHCTYCDFFTKAFPGAPRVRAFALSLAAGIRNTSRNLGIVGEVVDTIYFGGGTPSLLEPPDLQAVLQSVHEVFRVLPGAEVSLEANPESVSTKKLEDFRSLGVNRLSLGIQSFQMAILETLGRAHSPDRAKEAFAEARSAGFENVSLDLMLALPGQSREALRRDLDTAIALSPEHLSTYLLEMDKETALRARIERGDLTPASEDEAAEMYEMTRASLQEAGFRHYELSNFARKGRECRHNLKYWTDLPFVGFGPSAWSYLSGRRFREAPDLEGYLLAASGGVAPRREEETRKTRDRLADALFAGLRLVEGVDLDTLGRAYGIEDPLEDRRGALGDLEAAGFVVREGSRLKLASRSYPIANEIFQIFV